MDCSTADFPVLHYLQETAQTHVHCVDDAIQSSRPMSPPSPAALNLSQHQGLFSESALHTRGSKYWSFSFSISLFDEYSGLISFRIDWFDILVVQETFKGLLQPHNYKCSILRLSASLSIQLSHPYMTTGKPQLQLYGPLLAK